MTTTEGREAVDVDQLCHAAELVVTAQHPSASMLQRKLRLRTPEQARAVLHRLEEAGVVGPIGPNPQREVLVKPDGIDEVIARLRATFDPEATAAEPDGDQPDDDIKRGGFGVQATLNSELNVDRGAEVAVRGEGAAAEVYAGELVNDGPDEPAPVTLVGRLMEPVHVITDLATSPEAKRAGGAVVTCGRVAARAIYTTGQGVGSWATRLYKYATHGRLREQIDAAVAAKDWVGVAAAEKQLDDARNSRMKRLMALPKLVTGLIGLSAVVLVAVVFALAVLGGVVQLYPGGWDWSSWWATIFWLVDLAGTVGQWVTLSAACGVLPLGAVLAYREGKRRGRPPRRLMTPGEQAEADSVIDERMISLALANLGISALTNYFKEGGLLEFSVMPRKDGDGTFAQAKLPPIGVTAEMIAERRPRLAGNLRRASLETWPTKGEDESVFDLWVADKGVLSAGAGEWPLLTDGDVDVFEGVPIGLSQRGDVVTAPLFEANYLIGGRPGQGKSAAMRTLLLGAALDPTAELWVYVMGESPDFKPFEPRLTRYAMGMDDRVAAEAVQALRDLLAEMERRGKVLGQQPGSPPKTSRKLAKRREFGLHPIVCAIDECHELFQHPEFKKEAEDLAVRLIKRGRKYGIILVLATQSPTATSLPKEITRNISCGVAFSVADHVANDGLLGTGKYKAGIRATELRMKTDRGTSVTVGITDNTFELIRWYYVPFEDGRDDVSPVITRAMLGIKELRQTGRPCEIEPAPPADHLADIRESLRGETRVRTAVILGRLIEADADTYEPWSFRDLKAALGDVPVRKYGGDSVVYLEDVQEALRDRKEKAE